MAEEVEVEIEVQDEVVCNGWFCAMRAFGCVHGGYRLHEAYVKHLLSNAVLGHSVYICVACDCRILPAVYSK